MDETTVREAPPRRRALVVDDDELARRVLETLLRRNGFQVRTENDGLAGLRALVDEILDLDVVVTDFRMPGLNGEELVRRIRESGGERDVGIVVVSGCAPDEARLRAIGVDAVVGKSDGIDAIAAAVDQASARAAQARGYEIADPA
jgi:CheY-like chemotaxis protein